MNKDELIEYCKEAGQTISELDYKNRMLEKKNQELKKQLEEYKSPIKYFKYANKNVTEENKQLKDNWNKLKEYIYNQIPTDKTVLTKHIKIFEVLDKMQEIEESDSNENNNI